MDSIKYYLVANAPHGTNSHLRKELFLWDLQLPTAWTLHKTLDVVWNEVLTELGGLVVGTA